MGNGFSDQMWELFAQWITENHSDDTLTLYTDASQTMQRTNDEAIALWEQPTEEYVEAVNAASS